jgi:THO complex subunit 5
MSSKRKRSSSKAGKGDSQPQTPTEKKRPKLESIQADGPLNGSSGHNLAETFVGACSRIGELLRRVNDLKKNGDNTNLTAIDECKGEVSLLVMKLKQNNREAQIRCKEARDKTNEARQRIDDQHLQLQNMLYQVMHLQKEIHECLEFKSRDEDIKLVPIEEFYEEAPESVSKPDETRADQHKCMLARLDWELEQRKRLTHQLEVATSEKQKVLEDIESKQKFLSSLQPQLDVILKATLPVQEQMGMLFERTRTQHNLALYLPESLYVLFVQARAYQEALGM